MNSQAELTHTHPISVDLGTIRKPGSVEWCKRCSRRHRSREACDLTPVERVSKAGNKVMRLAHVPPKPKGKVKKRARKS